MAIGELARADGNMVKAENAYRAAIEVAEGFDAADPRLPTSLGALGDLVGAQGQYGEAEALFRRALALREKALGASHPDLVPALASYGAVLRRLGRDADARAVEARARAIRARAVQ